MIPIACGFEQRRSAPLLSAAVLVGVATMALACGTSSAAPPTGAGDRTPSLQQCVSRWNGAALGSGRLAARGVSGNGRAALMFAFRDGSCGLAFPTLAARQAGIGGVFVSGMDGDYVLNESPLGGPSTAPTAATTSRLETEASHQTNVRVLPGSGRLTPDRGAKIVTEHLNSIDKTSTCPSVAPPPSANNSQPLPYRIVSTTAACVQVRVIAWAWTAKQGTLLASTPGQAARQIVGWRCTGPNVYGPAAADKTLTCAKGSQSIVLQGVRPTLTG